MLRNWQAFQDLAKRFAGGDVCLRVAGLAGSARALAVAELLQIHPRPVLVIVASLADAHRFAQDLKFFRSEERRVGKEWCSGSPSYPLQYNACGLPVSPLPLTPD